MKVPILFLALLIALPLSAQNNAAIDAAPGTSTDQPQAAPDKDDTVPSDQTIKTPAPETRQTTERKKPAEPVVLPSLSAGLQAGYGLTYPGGDVVGNGDQKRNMDTAFQISLYGLYRIKPGHEILLSCGYTGKTLSVSRSFAGEPLERTIETRFINLSPGYRYLPETMIFSLFGRNIQPLFGAGLYYGIKWGTWKDSSDLNGTVTETDVPGGRAHNDYGLYLEAGLAWDWQQKIRTLISLKADIGIARVYENSSSNNDDSLTANSLIIMIGCEYHLPFGN